MTSRADLLGRHPWRAISGVTQMPNDPRQYLNGTGGWSSPDSTINVMDFVAGADISLGEALFLLPDGAVAPADNLELDQAGKYCGVSLGAVPAGGTVFAQMYGLLSYHLPQLQAGRAVFVGQNGEITQNYPTDGYRQKIGKALNEYVILLEPGPCVITAAQSDAIAWPGGVNAGTDALEWATLPDLRAGVASRMATAPDVLAAWMRENVEEYGLTPDKLATMADVQAGSSKLVTANILRQYVLGAASGVEFCSTAEIEAGLVGNKAMSPAAFLPIYEALKAGGGTVEFATPGETLEGLLDDKSVTPFGLASVRNDILNQVSDMIAGLTPGGGGQVLPKATVGELLSGAAVNKYVGPYEWRTALDSVLAGYTPGTGTSGGYAEKSFVGDGVTKVFPVKHDLDVGAPFVIVYDQTKEPVWPDIKVVDNNNLTVSFAKAPASGATYIVGVGGGLSAGGGGGITSIPWASDYDFSTSAVGKVATITQIRSLSMGGGGGVPQEIYNRLTTLETWKNTEAPVLATRAEVIGGTTDPRKVPSVSAMREYAEFVGGGGGGGTPGEIATLSELIKGTSNTKAVSPAGVHYLMRLCSLTQTDANGNYFITGMTDA